MAVSLSRNRSIGTVTISQTTRTTIANQNFKPKPNVALNEIIDVTTVGVQDGFTLIYNSDTGRYEAQPVSNAAIRLDVVFGGSF